MTHLPPTDSPLVDLVGIRKSFGDLLVSDGVDLSIQAGEVHALLGENGAGKTTLMRILYGLTRADAGEIRINGEPVSITSPKVAISHGIGMVTQHFALVKPMTVTENIILGSMRTGPVDFKAARQKVVATAERLGLSINPDAKVEDLSIGEQQRVEILKALYHDCKVLILDEPTAVLVPQDVEALFSTLRNLTAQGLGVLFISHKLHEVLDISQRVSVLRRGRIVDEVPTKESTAPQLAELMVGQPTIGVRRKDRDADLAQQEHGHMQPVLKIRNLTLAHADEKAVLNNVNFDVFPGEIVGIAGVSGNGQKELVAVLCGMTEATGGSAMLAAEPAPVDIARSEPADIIKYGLGRVSEDRHANVVPELSVEQNLVIEELSHPAGRRRYKRGPFLDRARVRAHANELIQRYSIKARPTDPIGSLSGGNMQKVLLARALERDPAAVVIAQPTRGLDVGAASFVHSELIARCAAGTGILLISEDLDELLALSDRLLVMYEGEIVGEMAAENADISELGLLMAGLKSETAADTQEGSA